MLLCAPAWAVDTVLMHGDKITVTAQDMQADSLRIPPEMRGRVLSRQALEERLYAFDDEIAGNAVEVYVSRLRAKLGAEVIETRRGLGYLVP